MISAESTLRSLFDLILRNPRDHRPDCEQFARWDVAARACIAEMFGPSRNGRQSEFGPFGKLQFPYIEMGAITSLHLFGLNELVLFAFYEANRSRYKRALDCGANIGLHSIVLARCGFEVRAFEPDPIHAILFRRNLLANALGAQLYEAALSIESGSGEFIRVMGNTTGSHLAGAKPSPYGELQRFPVDIEAAVRHFAWADLAKIDIEGHEAELIVGLPASVWRKTDALVEIGSEENAERVFADLHGTDFNLFAQKIGWDRVTKLVEMPTSHRDGSLFISSRNAMPWLDSLEAAA